MPHILMLGTDRDITQLIKPALPADAGIEFMIVSPLEPLPERLNFSVRPALVVVDTKDRQDVTAWVQVHAQDGAPVVAIISDAAQRAALFGAGVSDVLMRPLVMQEIKARLSHYLWRHGNEVSAEERGHDMPGDGALDRLNQQILQNGRWITIGRLIAAICHDITNRMQAMQGALSLAAEEAPLSSDMQTYLAICEQESRRVSEEIERLRSTYHPEGDRLGAIDVAELLALIRVLISDSSTARGLVIEMGLEADIPKIRGRAGQIQYVLLGLLLNMIDLIGSESSGHIWIEARLVGPTVQIEISTDATILIGSRQDGTTISESQADITEHALGLPNFRQVIHAQNGDTGLSWNDPGLSVWLSLPIM